MATERVTFTLTKGMVRRIDELAENVDRSRSKYVDMVLLAHLKKVYKGRKKIS